MAVRRFIILLFMFSFLWCSKPLKDPELKKAGDVILGYNSALIECYILQDTSSLKDLATDVEIGKVEMVIAGHKQNGWKMRSRLKKIQFLKGKLPSPNWAEIETREFWEYYNEDIKNGKLIGEKKKAEMHMKYQLLNFHGKWYVAITEALN